MSQLKKGAILSYITIILTNIVGLVLTPYIIKKLGNAEYGLYTLIGALIAQISVLNLGLNNAVIRFVAKYRAEKDPKAESNFLATVMLIYAFISFLIVIVGFFLYQHIDSIFKSSLTIEEIKRAKPMFLVLLFNLAITIPGGTFEAICNAYENFVFPRFLNIIKYISRTVLIFGLLNQFPNAFTLIWIDTALNILFILFTMYYVFRYLKIKFILYEWNLSFVKEIFSYSIWIFIFAIAYQFQWYAGQSILGITTDTVTVAIFGVGILLGGYYGAFAGAINSLLLPKATKMSVTNNTPMAYTDEMIRIGNIIVFILFFILSGFFCFGKAFIILWVGSSFLPAWIITLLIMLSMTLPLVLSFGNAILEAKKKNRYKAIINILSLSISVFIGYFASIQYGMYGVIIPICSAVFINSILMSFYYKKIFGFQIIHFFKMVLFKPLLLIIALCFSSSYILKYFAISSWIQLIVGIVVFSIAYISFSYFFTLNSTSKSILFKR